MVDLAHAFHGAPSGCWQQGTSLTQLCTASLQPLTRGCQLQRYGSPCKPPMGLPVPTASTRAWCPTPVGCKQVPGPRGGQPGQVGTQGPPRLPSAHAQPQPIFSHAAQLASCPVAEQCHYLVHCWAKMHNFCISWIFNWQPLCTLQSFTLLFFLSAMFCFSSLILANTAYLWSVCCKI